MAHFVEQMAYVGATPWHGLGNRLTQKQPLEVWQREAGMDWQIQESPVHFKADTIGNLGTIHSFPEQKVLYRSDTKSPCRWFPTATKLCSLVRSWSSTGI